jgi:hypothetical protein
MRPLKAVREKIGKLKLLPLLAKCKDFTQIVHVFYVLPLIPVEHVVQAYEVEECWVFGKCCRFMQIWPYVQQWLINA